MPIVSADQQEDSILRKSNLVRDLRFSSVVYSGIYTPSLSGYVVSQMSVINGFNDMNLNPSIPGRCIIQLNFLAMLYCTDYGRNIDFAYYNQDAYTNF